MSLVLHISEDGSEIEQEHDDPLGLGEVKQCLLVFDSLEHLCVTKSGSFSNYIHNK